MKNLKIALTLFIICLICAAGISGMYLLTNPIIEANTSKTELETIQTIYENYDQNKSETQTADFANDYITKKIVAKDSNGTELGLVYIVSGKNAYGTITLMVAINNGNVYRVEFLENGQSFATTVNSFLKSNFPSSKDSVIEGGFVSDSSSFDGELPVDKVDSIDASCGATYGAKLIKELVNAAIEDSEREVK